MRTPPIRLALCVAIAAAVPGCGEREQRPAPAAAAAEPVPRRPFRDVGCGITEQTVIEGSGVGAVKVGERLPEVTGKCQVVGDSTVRPEGMTERIIAVDAGYDTVTAVVVAGRIWRVHVHGPGFQTSDSLGVGTPAPVLRAREGSRFLAGEGLAFVTLDDHCGLSFRLSGVSTDVITRGEWPAADDLSDAVVDEVLIIGCAPDPPAADR
jgi:hypothetical protein